MFCLCLHISDMENEQICSKCNTSFRKLAHYRQLHTAHYAYIYTVLYFAQEGKKKNKPEKLTRNSCLYNAEQVHSARTKIKTD